MNLKSLILIFASLLLVVACNNSDDGTPLPEGASLLLKKTITTFPDDDEPYIEYYNYDGNKLISVSDDDGDGINFIYENDMLTQIHYPEDAGYYTVLNYDDSDRLSSYIVYIGANSAYKFELTYNEDNTVTEKEYYGSQTSQTSLISEAILTINNGQIITKEYIDAAGSIEKITYNYDTNNGIYKNIAHIDVINLIADDFIYYIDSAENNLLKTIETYSDNTTEVIEECQYTYNSAGYPETATFYYGGDEETTQYIYE